MLTHMFAMSDCKFFDQVCTQDSDCCSRQCSRVSAQDPYGKCLDLRPPGYPCEDSSTCKSSACVNGTCASLDAFGPKVVVNGDTMQCDISDLVTGDGVTWFSPRYEQGVCAAAPSRPTFTFVPASKPDADGNQKYNIRLSSVNWDIDKKKWLPSKVRTTSQVDGLYSVFAIDASPMGYGRSNCMYTSQGSKHMSQGSPSTVACREVDSRFRLKRGPPPVFYVRAAPPSVGTRM